MDEFLAPRQTILKPGASTEIAQAIIGWGIEPSRAFIVADKTLVRLGALHGLIDDLESHGFSTHVFGEIAGEPGEEIIGRALSAARREKPVVVVGVGGGSALDSAKLVAYLLHGEGEPADLKGEVLPLQSFPPLVLIPTTTGTGSEATRVAMFSVSGAKRAVISKQFVPMIAVLDTDMVKGLPAAVIASTALDALSHAVESMISTSRNQLTMLVASEAARLVFRHLPAAVHNNDDESKGHLLYASYLAGLALNAGVVLGHSLSYAISSRLNLPHGTGTALALPFCLAYNNNLDPELASEISSLVTGDAQRDLKSLAHQVAQLTASVGLPTNLSQAGMKVIALDKVAKEVVSNYPRPNNPVAFDVERIRILLKFMHSGDIEGAWIEMTKDGEGITH